MTYSIRYIIIIRLLHSLQKIDSKKIETGLGDIPKLDDTDRSICEGKVTYDECWKAVKSIEKSPGSNGLSFTKTFSLFGECFVKMADGIFDSMSEYVKIPNSRII
jgi:hypothetical protein